MFRVIYDDVKIGAWVMARTPNPQRKGFDTSPPPLRGIGYEVDGKIVAGFIFFNHAEWYKTIDVGIALETKSPILRSILKDVMRYPFIQLGCNRVTAHVPKRAKASRRLVNTVGFTEEGNIRHGFGIDDCIIYGILKKEAQEKWGFEN